MRNAASACRPLSIAAALLLVACKPAAAPVDEPANVAEPAAQANAAAPRAPAPAEAAPLIALDGEGLRLVAPGSGSSRAIAFGTPKAEVLATLSALRGAPATGSNDECGAGPMEMADWTDGLSLNFQEGSFVGWSLDKQGLSTIDGLAVGATRAELGSGGTSVKIFESTLGTEFTAGAIGGLLDGPGPAAKVTDLWAGTTCMFR